MTPSDDHAAPSDAATPAPPIAADLGRAPAASGLRETITGDGSGENGPGTAQTGMSISLSKNDYLTAPVGVERGPGARVGEEDGLYITTRQGGSGDSSGLLIDAQTTTDGSRVAGFVNGIEAVVSMINPSTDQVVFGQDLQVGSIGATLEETNGYGFAANAVAGRGFAAFYAGTGANTDGAPATPGAWQYLLFGAGPGTWLDWQGNARIPGSIDAGDVRGEGFVLGGDPNGRLVLGRGAADAERSSTPYLDFAGHGAAQDCRVWAGAPGRFSVQVPVEGVLADVLSADAGHVWTGNTIQAFGGLCAEGAPVWLDGERRFWVRAVAGRVAVGSGDATLFSVDPEGNLRCRGRIIPDTEP